MCCVDANTCDEAGRKSMDLRHTVTKHWTEQTSADQLDYLTEEN
ncbi:hypothetical protein [Brachybacterium sp.]|nr:hypothetical protein [Brachybacterium sp.]